MKTSACLTPDIIEKITDGVFIGNERMRKISIKGVVRDNREVVPGNMFACFRGKNFDGHSFVNDAFRSGAVCCLAEKHLQSAEGPYILVESTLEAIKKISKYYRSLFDIPVIGITGSVGKTTAKELVSAVLGVRYNVHKTLANMNNELGVPLTLLALDENHDVAVIEMGISDFGEMEILADMVRPDILVMTKIGLVHLEKLKDLDGVLRAKGEVFNYMKQDGVTVLGGDDDMLWAYAPGIRKITFGLDKRNDYRAENIRSEGTKAVLCDIVTDQSVSSRFAIKIPAYGSHLAMLAPAAAAVGQLLGLSCDEIRRGFLSFAAVSGRANVIDTGSITLIDDCYNANPHSVREALISLAGLPGRRVAILGDMFELGGFSAGQHRAIGVFAAERGVDILLCSGDAAAFMYEGYTSAGGKASRYYADKAELISALPELIKKGDTVLVKASHGMHFDEILPFLLKRDFI